MQFCDACGSMMRHDDGRMVCANENCGEIAEQDTDRAAEFVSTAAQSTDDVIESDPDADFEGKPIADDVTCDDCDNDEAWYTIKQTGSADEPPTRFFKCTECGNRWRGYS
jgi:DNA-directed RNA polymerase subunit M